MFSRLLLNLYHLVVSPVLNICGLINHCEDFYSLLVALTITCARHKIMQHRQECSEELGNGEGVSQWLESGRPGLSDTHICPKLFIAESNFTYMSVHTCGFVLCRQFDRSDGISAVLEFCVLDSPYLLYRFMLTVLNILCYDSYLQH